MTDDDARDERLRELEELADRGPMRPVERTRKVPRWLVEDADDDRWRMLGHGLDDE
jgi:hypothetical protein